MMRTYGETFEEPTLLEAFEVATDQASRLTAATNRAFEHFRANHKMFMQGIPQISDGYATRQESTFAEWLENEGLPRETPDPFPRPA